MANTPFKLKSGNKTSFKDMGSSPLNWHKPGHGKGLFESITGRKFKETSLGKDLTKKKEDIQGLVKDPKKHVITKDIEKKLKKETNVDVLGTKGLEVHKSSSGSGVIKPSGKDKTYTSVGGKGHMFTRGGGDPYQYRTTDEGQTFEFKKVGETGWSRAKGGLGKIMTSYEKSKSPAKTEGHGAPKGHKHQSDIDAAKRLRTMKDWGITESEGKYYSAGGDVISGSNLPAGISPAKDRKKNSTDKTRSADDAHNRKHVTKQWDSDHK